MLNHIAHLIARADDDAAKASPAAMNPTMIALLVVLLVLVVVAGLLVAGLLFMRQRRRARKQLSLPSDFLSEDEKRLSSSSTSSLHRRHMTRPSQSIYVYEEKKNLIDNSDSPPPSPLPQITITFPEEFDEAGKRKSGRVVVVRVGDAGVAALESSDALPAYQQQDEFERFQSIDLQRVGGLVEKARNGPNYKI